MWKSSNPALHNDQLFKEVYGGSISGRENVATLRGVVNKTAMLVGIAVIAGATGYSLVTAYPSFLLISNIAALLVALGIFFVIRGQPRLAPVLGPIYAIVEGAFLGALTGLLDDILAKQGYAVAGGLALQAFIITICIMLAMLGLYSARIIRPTQRFKAVVGTFTVGIMLTYGASWLLYMFGMSVPFVNLGSALAGGTAGWIGLGINVLFLGIASLWLIIDFERVEETVATGGPKNLEWYCGFALLVSLAWIYYEAVKMAFRIAVLLGNRD